MSSNRSFQEARETLLGINLIMTGVNPMRLSDGATLSLMNTFIAALIRDRDRIHKEN